MLDRGDSVCLADSGRDLVEVQFRRCDEVGWHGRALIVAVLALIVPWLGASPSARPSLRTGLRSGSKHVLPFASFPSLGAVLRKYCRASLDGGTHFWFGYCCSTYAAKIQPLGLHSTNMLASLRWPRTGHPTLGAVVVLSGLGCCGFRHRSARQNPNLRLAGAFLGPASPHLPASGQINSLVKSTGLASILRPGARLSLAALAKGKCRSVASLTRTLPQNGA